MFLLISALLCGVSALAVLLVATRPPGPKSKLADVAAIVGALVASGVLALACWVGDLMSSRSGHHSPSMLVAFFVGEAVLLVMCGLFLARNPDPERT